MEKILTKEILEELLHDVQNGKKINGNFEYIQEETEYMLDNFNLVLYNKYWYILDKNFLTVSFIANVNVNDDVDYRFNNLHEIKMGFEEYHGDLRYNMFVDPNLGEMQVIVRVKTFDEMIKYCKDEL
jgi:hypothetical protein